MPKVILYIAASLDGYIARPDGNLDWLNSWPKPENGDYGYSDLLKGIGSIVMGRTTYEEVLSYGIEWPYSGFDTYVVTGNSDFRITTPDTHVVHDDLTGFVSGLKHKTDKDIWLVGGGRLITSFLNIDALDKMIITFVPIVLGDGISLFPDKPKESRWSFTKVKSFNTGLVSLIYEKEQ